MNTSQTAYVERKERFQSLSKIRVIIITDKGKQEGHLVDISASGILVHVKKAIPVGQSCSAKIYSKFDNTKPTLSATGAVVREEASSLGIKFSNEIAWWFLFCILTSFEKPENFVGETVCCAA
ncbi:PilZ domain-containing protein [Desulfonema limicola]|uniref:PilZ domain-containing protein n=1 Tax=Desulfonema limicola TaxID=45656 RepID=A0A975B4V6_9BACT|nr:PilZ domain-containing protein [Desulfonema limicola]QTA78789.1 PilZ domain-containing protein [Desulfonema limicola]